jgi:hypothetical protein
MTSPDSSILFTHHTINLLHRAFLSCPIPLQEDYISRLFISKANPERCISLHFQIPQSPMYVEPRRDSDVMAFEVRVALLDWLVWERYEMARHWLLYTSNCKFFVDCVTSSYIYVDFAYYIFGSWWTISS